MYSNLLLLHVLASPTVGLAMPMILAMAMATALTNLSLAQLYAERLLVAVM